MKLEEHPVLRMYVGDNCHVNHDTKHGADHNVVFCDLSCVQEGYRTLCVAYKKLSEDEYMQAEAGLREARLALQDREEQLMAVYNQVETGMSLIGATAVEDRWVKNTGAPFDSCFLISPAGISSADTFFLFKGTSDSMGD